MASPTASLRVPEVFFAVGAVKQDLRNVAARNDNRSSRRLLFRERLPV
jgi:hypothetical protein